MEKKTKKYTYLELSHAAIYQELTQHRKSTIPQNKNTTNIINTLVLQSYLFLLHTVLLSVLASAPPLSPLAISLPGFILAKYAKKIQCSCFGPIFEFDVPMIFCCATYEYHWLRKLKR